MTRMSRMHVCGEGCYDSEKMMVWIFYSEVTGTWQMDAGADFLTIKYCPFCGLELSLELRAEQDDEKRSHTEFREDTK